MNPKINSRNWLGNRTVRVVCGALIAALGVIILISESQAAWYDSNWQYRKKLTIDYTKVAATLSYFPVLVSLSSDSDLAARARSDGYDILFTGSDGTTKLDHEIEKYTTATGALVAWVKIPSLSNTVGTDIYMYYGYASATNQQNATGVWNDGGSNYYKGVWHLKESGNGTAGEFKDSTSNNNHGQGGPSGACPTISSTGKIGDAENYDGADYISVPNAASLQPTTAITLSGWIYLRTFGSGSDTDPILRKGEANPNNYDLMVDDQKAQFILDSDDGQTELGTTILSTNTWYYIVGTWQSGGQRTVYVNGVQEGTGAFTGPIGTDTRALYIGGRAGGGDLIDGLLD